MVERSVRIREVMSSNLTVSTMMHLSEHEATIVVLPTVFVLTVSLPAGV